MAQPPWWQRGVIYHIYPRSWMDSDGDGVGDLSGILARLDHLTWLGVAAAWISPVYPSPAPTSATTWPTIPRSTPCSGPWRTWTG